MPKIFNSPLPITRREMQCLIDRGAVRKDYQTKAGVLVRTVISDVLPPGVLLQVYEQPEIKPMEKNNEH